MVGKAANMNSKVKCFERRPFVREKQIVFLSDEFEGPTLETLRLISMQSFQFRYVYVRMLNTRQMNEFMCF